jgi:DNA-binding IclR family transcriptional regulator
VPQEVEHRELADARSYRTSCVLNAIAELGRRGWGPSNREIAERTGIRELKADPLQMSRLLWCLEALELIENTTRGELRGGPNAWRLTAKGAQLQQVLEAQGASGS